MTDKKVDAQIEMEEGAFCPIDPPHLIGRRDHGGKPCTNLGASNDQSSANQEDTGD